MASIPDSVEEAISQAQASVAAAMEAGYNRIQVELVIPEITLQAESIAQEFSTMFEGKTEHLKLFFPDTGAAALAKRNWGQTWFKIEDVGSSRSVLEGKVTDEDEIFLFVAPSAVEVEQVEKLCRMIGDRTAIFLIPKLEEVAIIGIGYAGRQLRERFLNNLFSAYYLRPLEGVTVYRAFPETWQVYLEKDDNYELFKELPNKPSGEELERMLYTPSEGGETGTETAAPPAKKPGIFGELQRFLKALSS